MALPVFLALRITGSVFFVVKGHVIHSQAEIYLAIVVCQVLAFFFFFLFVEEEQGIIMFVKQN